MSFIYFLATSKKQPDAKEIRAAGLDYAFDSGGIKSREVISGPGGQRGLVLSRNIPDDLKYDPANQDWKQVSERAWVGKHKAADIKAGDLQRASMVDGVRVEMADGSIWLAAHARKFTELEPGTIVHFCPLPRTLAFIDGKWVPSKIHRRFQVFAELAEEYQQAAYEALETCNAPSATITFQFPKLDDFAVMAITANYYASHAELSFLDAYDIESRKRLIAAAMDEETVERWQKKRIESAQDGSALSDGLAHLTQDAGL